MIGLSSTEFDLLKTGAGTDRVHVLPIGGCGQFGMNVTLYVYRNELFVVDCGLQFGDEAKPGVDSIIPHLEPFIAPFDRVAAYVITHGHEDHIGALPFVHPRWPAPIYASKWTAQLISNKFTHKAQPLTEPVIVIEAGYRYSAGALNFQFVPVNHSIPMAGSLALEFGDFHILHSGDYKIDRNPVGEPSYGTGVFEQLRKKKPFDLFLSDSTNAMSPGFSPSESETIPPLREAISGTERRVIATTFSSNIWRLRTLLTLGKEAGRRVIPFGQGILSSLALAKEFEFVHDLDETLGTEDDYKRLPPDKVMVIATGSQSELGSGMHRIANNEHAQIKISPGDLCILSSRVIPGNERYVGFMTDKLLKLGANLLTGRSKPGVHVSGHGYSGDIREFIDAIQPRYFVPVHGTWAHLKSCAEIGKPVPEEQTKTQNVENGDLLRLTKGSLELLHRYVVETRYVDSYSRAVAAPEEFRERFKIGELGLGIVWGCLKKAGTGWVVPPTVSLHGCPFPDRFDQDEWISKTEDVLAERLLEKVKNVSLEEFNENARITFRRMLAEVIGRKAVVITQLLWE